MNRLAFFGALPVLLVLLGFFRGGNAGAAETYLEAVGSGNGAVVDMATSASSGYTYILNQTAVSGGTGIISVIDSSGDVMRTEGGSAVLVPVTGKPRHIAAGRTVEGDDAIYVIGAGAVYNDPWVIDKWVRQGSVMTYDDQRTFNATGGARYLEVTDMVVSAPSTGTANLTFGGYYQGTVGGKDAANFVSALGTFAVQFDGFSLGTRWEHGWGVRPSALQLVVANSLVDPASRTAENPQGVERPWKEFPPDTEPKKSHPTSQWPHHDFNLIHHPGGRKDLFVEDLSSSFYGDLYGRVIGIKNYYTNDGSMVLSPGAATTFWGRLAWDIYESGNGKAYTAEGSSYRDPATGGATPLRDGTNLGRMSIDSDGIGGSDPVWGGALDNATFSGVTMPAWQLQYVPVSPRLAVDESGSVFVASVSPRAYFLPGSEIEMTVSPQYAPNFNYYPTVNPFTIKIDADLYKSDLRYRLSLPALGLGLSDYEDLPVDSSHPYVLKILPTGSVDNRIYAGPDGFTTIKGMGAAGGSLVTVEGGTTSAAVRKVATDTLTLSSAGDARIESKVGGSFNVHSLTVAPADRGVFLSGYFSGAEVDFSDPSGGQTTLSTAGGGTLFLAALNEPSHRWKRAVRAPNPTLPTVLNPTFLNWNAVTAKLNFAGSFAGGTFTIGNPGTERSLTNGGTSARERYYSELNSDLDYAQNIFLTVESAYGAPSDVRPHFGRQRSEGDRPVTVSVPLHVYEDAAGRPLDSPSEDQIERLAVTRRTVTGYTISAPDDPDLEAITGTGSEVSFTLKRDTTVTFHWTTEFAVSIGSDLTGTGRPVARWRLDEQGVVLAAADSTGGGHPATVRPDVVFGEAGAAAFSVGSARFDGTSGHLEVPYDAVLAPGSFTVAMWIRPERLEGLQYLFHSRAVPGGTGTNSGGAGSGVSIFGDSLYFDGYRGNGSSGGLQTVLGGVDQWIHVLASYDETSQLATLWIDGEQVGSQVLPRGVNTGGRLYIGAKNPDEAFFQGGIDDVALFDRALSGSEIGSVMERGRPPIGLDSQASGNPSPEAKKHWVEEDGLFTAFVDGAVADPDDFGTRYVVTGYRVTGAAGEGSTVAFTAIENRQQVPQFAVDGTGTVTFEWGVQHRVQVGTSSTASQGLPRIRALSSPNPAIPPTDRSGTGAFWFDRGTALQVGGLSDVVNSLSLRDALSATGALEGAGTNFESDGDFKYHAVSALAEGGTVVWDYGATIYRQVVTIGDPVVLGTANPFGFAAADVLTLPVVGQINTAEAPVVVALLDGPSPPAGSTAADMQVWDDVVDKSYPLRPGRFLMEWQKRGGGGEVIVTEITAGFAGDRIVHRDLAVPPGGPAVFPGERRDYRYLFDGAMPAVDLDPDDGDGTSFLALRYSSSATPASANGGEFSFNLPEGADAESTAGRHVLVFSEAAEGATAVGDLTRERLAVKVLESRLWTGSPSWQERDEWASIIATSYSDPTRVYVNDGSAEGFGADTARLDIAPKDESSIALASGDVDGDGTLDLVVGAYSGRVNRVFLNDGTYRWFNDEEAGLVVASGSGDPNDAAALALGDMDGDGDLDLIVGGGGGGVGRDRLNLNNGSAQPFSDPGGESRLSSDILNTGAVAVGDVDGDGDLDVVAGIKSGVNRLYVNGGGPQPFDPIRSGELIAAGDAELTLGVALGDVDGDGDLDLVVGNYGAPNRLYFNDGSAIPFRSDTSGVIIPTSGSSNTSAVKLADVDGDGDLDLVAAISGGVNRLYLNDGSANPFAAAGTGTPIGSDSSGTTSLALGDVNNDGTLDLVAGNSGGVDMLYLNDGSAAPFASVSGIPISSDRLSTQAVLIAPGPGPVLPLVSGGTVPIGRKITSAADTAGLGTGFVVNAETARLNPQVYDRALLEEAGPIIPVNRQFSGDPEDEITVVWFERVDGILWPYQSERYPNVDWPAESLVTTSPGGGSAPPDRIVIASRLGSEGRNDQLDNQFIFDTDRFRDVTLYNQPDPDKAGYNPNEEHALIAPSLKFLDSPNPPPVAFALRAGELNTRSLGVNADGNPSNDVAHPGYTSDPYVLVQFFDNEQAEWRMAVYSVETEDQSIRSSEQQYSSSEITVGGEISFRDFFSAAHGYLEGEKVEVSFDGDVQGLNSGGQYYVLRTDAIRFGLSGSIGGDGITVPTQQMPLVKVARLHPHTFDYRMKAGEPVQPPYPLGVVIGVTPCAASFGMNGGSGTGELEPRTYWEDFRGQAWSISGGDGSLPGELRGVFYYPMQVSFYDRFDVRVRNASGDLGDVINPVPAGTCLPFLGDMTNPPVKPVLAAEADSAAFREVVIHYDSVWPEALPILKAGETLTYAGGEYRADHPSAPGLPGVIGWASGRVVYDSLNPQMATGSTDVPNAFDNYAARLITPLEVLRVPLGLSAEQKESIGPATGITQVDRTVWRFTNLPASLKKRIFYDPVDDQLGIQGFVNDKTLGDQTLTAAPAPVYVLEPNLLTARDVKRLNGLKGTPVKTVKEVISGTKWVNAVEKLWQKSRNPAGLKKTTPAGGAPYYVGLEPDAEQSQGSDLLDQETGLPVTKANTARPRNTLGPGLALVPSAEFLNPDSPLQTGYVTLVENDDPEIGGPVSLHIIKLDKRHRYRGAVKTILSDNIFEEKITMRHTGEFGGNGDAIVYQWFYREEDGTDDRVAGLPPGEAWKLFPDQSDSVIKGLGMNQIDLEGTGGLVLSDNLFFVRYRHVNDVPSAGVNGVNWGGTAWRNDGEPEPPSVIGEHWAGAGNSPTVDGDYKPQLAQGWIKRVLDRINPYEVRFDDFRNNGSPATYVSMIQQAGQSYVGPVALNPDKDVIENLGLIELYQTVLDRGINLSIGLSQPITTPGVNNALQLAATRLSDLHMLLGNEAYADAQDPLVGYGTSSGEYGSAAPSIFPFQNQVASPLDEELALLRGMPESFGRPVFNRLFWNFTKSDGEVAYALNYNLSDVNLDGFVDESDAQIRYPQGHGDAWGQYTTALKSHYDLLRHPFFNWQPRAERYNLLDVVIDVDFLDERKFAYAAAARAQAGTEIVDQTYRSRYVADPDGQWQGYTDTDSDRAWGVQGWARRAGQGALFDWMTANFVLPAEDLAHTGVVNEAFKKIDRTTVGAISKISANLGKVQGTYDDANGGLNPLGLADGVVPFDIDPEAFDGGAGGTGVTHFEQVYQRAEAALKNAVSVFDYASGQQRLIRGQQDREDVFRDQVREQDQDLSNRLIEIFGSPYAGQIGTGKAYPAGYAGPDLFQWMYVDVSDFVKGVPVAGKGDDGKTPSQFEANFAAFAQAVNGVDGEFRSSRFPYFVTDIKLENRDGDVTGVGAPSGDTNAVLDMPLTADRYSFQAPDAWGRRASPGSLQGITNELLAAEADLTLTLGNYDNYIKELKDMADLLEAKHGVAAETIKVKTAQAQAAATLSGLVQAAEITLRVVKGLDDGKQKFTEAVIETQPKIIGAGTTVIADPTFVSRGVTRTASAVASKFAQVSVQALEQFISAQAAAQSISDSFIDIEFEKIGFRGAIREQIKAIEMHLRNDGAWRVDVFLHLQQLRLISDRYRAELEKGQRLLEEREDFNKHVGGVTQEVRYQDMAYRHFRNDSLQKYRAAFDLAAQYAYMAAKAYDYETNLDPGDPASATAMLEEIVKARHLGIVDGGAPSHAGGGLAGALATLRDNFAVLKGRLGINNPQDETGKFSLRSEHFRIKPAGTVVVDPEIDPDLLWRQTLENARVADLWEVPEFRRFCRPPRPASEGAIPGLVIPFGTGILEGKNFFGNALGAGDNSYDSTNFATKVLAAGVWFDGYDESALATAPRVYLVPAGADVMTIPGSPGLAAREWNVVDQAIPVPFPTGDTDLTDPFWIPAADSLNGPLAETRKFGRLRAYGNTTAEATAGEMTFDSRLVGRSVWNTNWLLIIPGTTLHADGDAGLDRFEIDVEDIKLFFRTYGYSGN